jgi:probable F420-dependent oxidoreductase
MQFGVFVFPTDYSMNVVDLGRAVEDHGFESFWVTEHTHIPTSRLSPWPGGAELPKQYSHTLDPFVGLAAVAAATTDLKLGTGVCLVIEHDPITLAKQVASIDFLSGGRFRFGIGGGWNREEMENHGTDPKTRWRLLREQIQAMKEIWTKDEAEYHGDFVNFDPIWSWPKPVQKPHPPILMGGNGPTTLQRIVEYCDEWFPIVGRGHPLEERIPELQRLAAEAGRGTIPVSIFNAPNDPKEIERLGKVGVTRCVFGLPSAGADEVLPLIDRLAETAKGFI